MKEEIGQEVNVFFSLDRSWEERENGMGIFDFFKRNETAVGETPKPEQRETGESELLRMLREIRTHQNEELQGDKEQEEERGAFYRILEKEVKKYVERKKQDNSPIDAMPLFYVSEDCMRALVCILPPANEGKDIEQERFLEDMHYEGIVAGVDMDAVERLIADKVYLRIRQVAQGKEARDGLDGALEELYERRYEQKAELDEEELLQGQDFRQRNLMQIVQEGEILCRVTLPVPVENGFDVSGTVLYGKEGVPVRVPQGKNTSISEDGLLLRAMITGIVVMEGDDFSIQSQRVLLQDIDASVGDLKFDGDIYIQGDVTDGVAIEATGNVMIRGNVRSGKIISGGTICVQGDVKGPSGISLKAVRQIQCMILENVSAAAGGDICAGIIANSEVTSEDGSIYVLMGRGLIFGSSVTASRSVHAKKIGNISGCVNNITLGQEDRIEKQRASAMGEMEEIDRTLEQIRKNISTMQIAGASHRPDMQEEYKNLMEQRAIYGDLKRQKFEELEELKNAMYFIQTGSICCEEIYPTTNIRIERQNLAIDQKETDCNIRLMGGSILLR